MNLDEELSHLMARQQQAEQAIDQLQAQLEWEQQKPESARNELFISSLQVRVQSHRIVQRYCVNRRNFLLPWYG